MILVGQRKALRLAVEVAGLLRNTAPTRRLTAELTDLDAETGGPEPMVWSE